jgi:DNA-binding NtrC family response regulator
LEDDLTALLVHDPGEPFGGLEQALLKLGIWTEHARSCSNAIAALQGPRSPGLVLTATALADGTWADVLNLANWAAVPVIVVSRVIDIDLYITTVEAGASDFIVPPLALAELAHVIKMATGSNPARFISAHSGVAGRDGAALRLAKGQ